MKEQLFIKTKDKGFSTLEILIAFFVLILALTAVVLVVFGNQATGLSTETNSEALYLAQKNLEDARAVSRDHNLFDSIVNASSSNSIYDLELSVPVPPISECIKQVTSKVAWTVDGRDQYVELSTLLSDPVQALLLGGNCASVGPGSDDWKMADSFHGNVTLDGSGTSIRARGNLLYVANKHNNASSPDLSIADISDIPNLTDADFTKLSIKHDGKELNGINDFELVKYPSLGKSYIFAAGIVGNPGNGGSNGEKPTGQLQVIDVTDFENPIAVASVSLPGVSGSCPDFCPSGRSIAYYDGRIYIGTHRVGGSEFHIYDVSNPLSPSHLGSTTATQVDHNINDIVVRDGKAYLATSSDTEEVIVLDVSNPGAITKVGSFNANGTEDGQRVQFLSGRLYLGRDRVNAAGEFDFYIIDASSMTSLGSKKINTQNNTTIAGIQVSSHLAFVASTDTNTPFSVWNVSDPANITRWDVCNYNFSVVPAEMYFDSNRIYVVATDQSDVRIIETTLACH